jgi:exonuclease III
MKIVTWNCNCALRTKTAELDEFDADVIVAQECEDPARSSKEFLEWAADYQWIGDNKHKGLGVFAKKSAVLQRLDWSDNGLQLFLPCRVNDKVNLVAVWTKRGSRPAFRYIGQLWQYLQLHKDKMDSAPTIICGDFNSNSIWDRKRKTGKHSDVVSELANIGIHSLYHDQTREKQGHECKPTMYMYRNIEKPYHIDYVFASEELMHSKNTEVEVGRPENWLNHSDHMPIMVKITI